MTNEWTSRQIGDRLLLSDKRILVPANDRTAGAQGNAGGGAFARPQILAGSGLLGEVRVISERAR